MSHSLYKDGEVVWVKWGSVWWPGEVWSSSRVPEDIITSLRKPVIAFVKFFQEDSYEFVRSENNISIYNCDKKMEHIKKGMDKYRTNNKIMTNFPADVVKAEQLTGGNANILSTLEASTPTKSRTSIVAASTAASPDVSKKTVQTSSPTAAAATKKTAGSYNSSVKVQNTTSSAQKPNEKKLTCTMCSFSTDRMNLLMMHIKNHSLTILSRVNSPSSSSSETRKPIFSRNSSKKSDADDGIAEDVRKIKESMKDLVQQQQQPSPSPVVKKTRTPAAKSTTPKVKSQAARRERKSIIAKDAVEEPIVVSTAAAAAPVTVEIEEKTKIDTHGLKNELLADWLDDDDIGADKNEEEKSVSTTTTAAAPMVVIPEKLVEKTGESSRSIRNIPKKQRVSEIYIQPEPEKQESASPIDDTKSTNDDVAKKTQKAGKRKHGTSDSISEPEKKKPSAEDNDDNKLLMATAELLNETEVPKSSNNVQSPSTFHKSNDIDKRYLPPKERNKRIFRARNSPDLTAAAVIISSATPILEEKVADDGAKDKVPFDENESKNNSSIVDEVQISPSVVLKTDRQELILPHKKKQSSRLLTTAVTTAVEKQISPVRETRNARESREKSDQSMSPTNVRNKRSRKSNDSQTESNRSVDLVVAAAAVVEETTTITASPLRDVVHDTNEKETKAKSPSLVISQNEIDNIPAPESRGQKRQRSKESVDELQSESKKFHKSSSPQPRSIVACSSETICITSKGTISVARRDSIKTTCANSVVVTSHVIISEATKQPIVTSQISTTDTTSSPKQSITTSVTLPPQQQTPKNALKIPKENIEELKKQGLVTVENNRTKLTPKGRQKFKEFQDGQSSTTSAFHSSIDSQESESPIKSEEIQRTNNDDSPLQPRADDAQAVETNAVAEKIVEQEVVDAKQHESGEEDNEGSKEKDSDPKEIREQDENENETIQQKNEIAEDKDTDDETSKVCEEETKLDLEKDREEIVADDKQNESTKLEEIEEKEDKSVSSEDSLVKPAENGNESIENDSENAMEAPAEDANSGGAGLIALQAETFGGPPNCFYLCRPVEGGYEPVDNQILVLNAQNALVPYDGEIVTETVQENLSAYSQLSPNSNIIINTPNGQKIELSHYAILALQEQADENGIASVELSGEQLELNINGILEAIQAEQETSESGVLAGECSDVPIIIEQTELPVEVHHIPSVATQVSETLSKPIMSTTIAPEIAINNPAKPAIAECASKSLNIEDSLASIGVKATPRVNVPKSLELPITVTNPAIVETVNHRKLAASILGAEAVPESFVIQPTDNGSADD